MDLNKEASVAVKLSAPIDISFRRNARGGIEEHLLADLTSLMDSVTLSNSGDRWVCDLVSDGNFRVKEIRNYIDDLFLPHQAAQTRWIKYIPIKSLTSSLASFGKIVYRTRFSMTGHSSKRWQSCLGFFQFSSPLRSKLCWRECSSYLGGLSGTLGIGSFLKNLLKDVRKFLML
ncbi:hypothetical protein Tco_1418254 [Tanacetum coccineum]